MQACVIRLFLIINHLLALIKFVPLGFFFFFYPKKTLSISYKTLQISVIYKSIYWIPTDSRKGQDNQCWMKASCCLLTPSELPLRPSYWLFRVATTSLYISCINIIGCRFGWRRLVYIVLSIESKELLGKPIPTEHIFGFLPMLI